MAGIWLDDATYQQTAGQIWAQQQTQNAHAGVAWAQQAMQDTLKPVQDSLSKLQQMVPQIPTTPTPAPAAPPPVAPPPVETPLAPMPAPPPPVPIGGTPVATPGTPAPGDLSTAGIAPPAAPTPPPPAPIPTPPSTPSITDVGQTWAQQQIANLLNPSAPQAPSPTPSPAPQPVPGLNAPPSPVSSLPDQTQAQGGVVPPATPATAPAAAPAPNVPAGPIDSSSPQAFAQSIAPYAQAAAQKLGIDPTWVAAMAASESNYGKAPGNELFGIKALPGQASQSLATHEGEYGGTNVNQNFAAYQSPQDAVDAYVNLIQNHYPGAVGAKDLGSFVHGLKQGGYFTAAEDEYKNILQGIGDRIGPSVQQGLTGAAGAGQTAVNTAVQGVQSAVARTSQFAMGLSSGDAMAFCGPAAAMAFADTYGRNPTVAEAKQLAQQVGWNPDQGMAGVGSEVKLLNAMGVDAHATQGVDWASVGRDASGGNPVIIDTPGHYYYVDGYNQQTGQLHVGSSGTDLKGGSEWMTPDQINAMPQSGGSARAAIFADHPLAQQDGLAQSTAASGGNSLTMGPLSIPIPQPGQSPQPMPGQPGGLITPPGQYNPAPGSLLSDLLAPTTAAAKSAVQNQANNVLQAVQDVGGQAQQAGQNLLQQGQQLLQGPQQVPQTVADILNQNAMTASGIPNIGGKALEGAQNLLGQGQQALGNLNDLVTNPDFQQQLYANSPTAAFNQNLQGLAGDLMSPAPDWLTNLATNTPVTAAMKPMSNLYQAITGPGLLESMKTQADLAQKYGGNLDQMTPEDQDAYRQASMALVGQMMPAPGAVNPVTMAERVRAYHVANAIGGAATVSKVALASAWAPAWSFATRGAADIAGGVTGLAPGLSRAEAFGRAGGSIQGAQAGMAGSVQAFMDGLRSVGNQSTSISGRATGIGDQIFGRLTEAPASLHSAFQAFGRSILQNTEIGRLYGQEAAAQGLTGSAFDNFVAQGLANPSQAIQQAAEGLAQRGVLRGDLGTLGSYFANMAGQGGGQAGMARGLIGNFLFPVFKVGMNHLTQTIEKSPLGLVGTGIDVARGAAGFGPYRGGNFEQPLSSAVAPLSERLTNNIAGTALAVWFGKLALDGTITGDGPTDPDQQRVLEGQGWQANSIRLPGGNYVSYKGTPLEGTLNLVGNYADVVNGTVPQTKLEQAQPMLLTAAERLVGHTLNMVMSPTGIETLGNIAELVHGLSTGAPEEFRRGGASTIANLASSWVPGSSTLRSAELATDPLQRQAPPGDVLGKIQTGIPGLAQQVQPRLDVLGRGIANPQQGLGAFVPARLGAGEPSPILAAMAAAGVTPSPVPQTIAYGPTHEVRLTPRDQQAWQQYRGQIIQQAAGPLVSSPDWAQMPARGQVNALSNIEARASAAANRLVLRDVVATPDLGGRDISPTGRLAPIQGYQPVGLGSQQALLQQAQSAALMQALLSGRTGRQGLQDAMQQLTQV